MVDEIVSSKPFIEGRGDFFCRGCLGENLFSALDLGDLPIANELLLTSEGEIEKFPLHLKICTDCGLGQVTDVVTPERIFRDYRYLSSFSTTFLTHALDFVNQQIECNTFYPEDWVLEIASNDGYLLKNFIPHGIRVVGVEPAENVSQLSRELGIETIPEFFSNQLASELLTKYGYPKLIIANNVMAHVPDLIDFIMGLATLCGPDTKVSIENSSLAKILLGMQFDTIYHEHYSYLSASSVAKLSEMHGLNLFKVEQLSIHGGSNRYWLSKSKMENYIDSSVVNALSLEQEIALFSPQNWEEYSIKVYKILDDFRQWLRISQEGYGRILGYGAAAKASTILNSIDATPNLFAGIADLSPEKQGRFMPTNGIQIISPEELFRKNPTDIVIFPWNIKLEIASYLRFHLGDEVRLWCLVPELHRVEI
jgi:2-polyprenyl-3-methyl-5-hydroxy-6-metoxy-1,4-benzoquinol methylase